MSSLSTKYRSGTKVQHQLFTTSGTWNKPAKFIEGTLLATGIGGGASGNYDATLIGGNSGEYVYQAYINVSDISSASVTIGTGGASQTTPSSAGNSGGVTSLGAKLTLSGGLAGTTSTVQGLSVGGATGGVFVSASSGYSARALNCAVGGSAGYRLSGDIGAATNVSGSGAGAGGIVLDGSGKAAGVPVSGGYAAASGYGAGGGASNASSGAGASGALFLTWQEYI